MTLQQIPLTKMIAKVGSFLGYMCDTINFDGFVWVFFFLITGFEQLT